MGQPRLAGAVNIAVALRGNSAHHPAEALANCAATSSFDEFPQDVVHAATQRLSGALTSFAAPANIRTISNMDRIATSH